MSFDFADMEAILKQIALAIVRLEIDKAGMQSDNVVPVGMQIRSEELDGIVAILEQDYEVYKFKATRERARLARLEREENEAECTLHWLRLWKYAEKIVKEMEADLAERRRVAARSQ